MQQVRYGTDKRLAQLEGQYRGLLEAAPDAMVMVNQGGNIALLNVQAEKQFGYLHDELLGQPVKNIIPDGFAERLIADGHRSAAEALAQQIGTGIELSGRRKDGSEFPIEIMLSPLEDAEGVLVTAAIRDISVRKAAETALRESERRFQDIAEISGDWIWESDREHRLTLFHGASTDQLIVRPESLLGQTRWAIAGADPETDKRWGAHKANLDAHLPFRRFLFSIPTSGGGAMFVSASGQPVFDEAHNFLGYRGAATDDTNLVKARDRAEQAESLMLDAIESISEGFVIYDDQDRLIMCNQGYRRLYPDNPDRNAMGVRLEDILRNGLAEGRFTEAIGCEEEWLADRIRRHRDVDDTVEQHLSNGRWVLITKHRMANGWMVGLRVDITVLKAAQAALSQSEEQLKLAQRLAHMGSDLRDLRTDDAEWSDETYRIFGVSRDTYVPSTENFLRVLHPDDLATVLATRDLITQGICPEPFEYRITRPDGSVRNIYRENELIRDEAGNALYLAGTIHDVTERRSTEEQLRQAQKMEAVGNLTGGMAHDFNNMLGVIIGSLDLAGPLVVENVEAAELVQEATDAALNAAELTRRLLAFARQQPLRPRLIESNELVSNIVQLLRRSLGENIEITLDLAANLWPVVADPAQLEAALTNLATNARDAMPSGGRLSIRTVNRHLDADYAGAYLEVTPGDYVAIEVTDTGTGMVLEVSRRIFEPFYTTKEVGKGTGLGLSMVFGFMKQSGGHINVYSEPNEGTTFRLYLPRAVVDQPADEEVQSTMLAQGTGETVLAVEDNSRLRRLALRQLQQLGYRPIAADGPAAALEILERENIDVLFTDVVMPGPIDGIALSRQVIERWPKVKIVLTSGFPGTELDHKLGRQHAAVPLLGKPYRTDDLGRVLREVLKS